MFGQIVAAAVRATEGTDIPVTVKFRIGIDDDHHTHLDAGRIAESEGAAAVALHARTAAQRYSGSADWEQIARLKDHVRTIPVLGNGDIFDASDALTMMAATGCDGVVIGRGCLGRPWLFAELSAAFTGRPAPTPPTLGEVADVIRRHASLLAAHFGEDKGMRDLRKHIAWYLHGFPAGSELRRALALVKTLDELDALLTRLDADVPFPPAAIGPRAGRDRPPGWRCPTGGWPTVTTAPYRRVPTSCTRAADSGTASTSRFCAWLSTMWNLLQYAQAANPLGEQRRGCHNHSATLRKRRGSAVPSASALRGRTRSRLGTHQSSEAGRT
ncbi:dihydrouridine synthase family protein [Mycobacterium xenopi 3993]|nr:dihydrouridine synthase family protein [Mycobacterium xenopi 3993]